MDKLLQVYEEGEIPQCLILADDSDGKVKLGIVDTSEIPERGRLSRAKVLGGTGINTKYIKGCPYMTAMTFVKSADKYVGNLKKVTAKDFIGDPSELEDGEYLELCKDLGKAV